MRVRVRAGGAVDAAAESRAGKGREEGGNRRVLQAARSMWAVDENFQEAVADVV